MSILHSILYAFPFSTYFSKNNEVETALILPKAPPEYVKVAEACKAIGIFAKSPVLVLNPIAEEIKPDWIESFAEIPTPAKPLPPYKASQRNLVTSFIPDLCHLFYRAFNVSSSTRPQHSLYEVSCVIGVYFHFLKIPYSLAVLITKVTQSVKQAFVANGLFFAISALTLYAYLKCKKGPDKIDYCQRMTIECRPLPLRDYTKAKAYPRVIVHGPPGVGKSSFLEGLAAELILKGKKVYKIENASVFGPTTFGVGNTGEKLQAIIDQAKEDPANSVIIGDEFGDATLGVISDREKFKNASLENLNQISLALKGCPEVTFYTAMLDEQLEMIREHNPSLIDRFFVMRYDRPDEEEMLSVLNDISNKEAPHIPVSKAALQAIIDHTIESKETQHRKAVEFLRAMIRTIEGNRLEISPSKKLEKARRMYLALRIEGNRADAPVNDPSRLAFKGYRARLAAAKEELDRAEDNFKKLKQDAKLYTDLQNLLQNREIRRNDLAREWVQSKDVEKQKLLASEIDYIHCVEIAKLQEALNEIKPRLGELFFEIDVKAVAQFSLPK